MAQDITGYAARKPAGNIIKSPTQNIASNRDAATNPGIRNATEFSVSSIAAMLAVSSDVLGHETYNVGKVIRQNLVQTVP